MCIVRLSLNSIITPRIVLKALDQYYNRCHVILLQTIEEIAFENDERCCNLRNIFLRCGYFKVDTSIVPDVDNFCSPKNF